jgi:hypothetical protein
LRGDGSRFCQQVKWLPQIGNQLPTLPGAVRNYEIEEPTFFARFLLLERSLRIPRELYEGLASSGAPLRLRLLLRREVLPLLEMILPAELV